MVSFFVSWVSETHSLSSSETKSFVQYFAYLNKEKIAQFLPKKFINNHKFAKDFSNFAKMVKRCQFTQLLFNLKLQVGNCMQKVIISVLAS